MGASDSPILFEPLEPRLLSTWTCPNSGWFAVKGQQLGHGSVKRVKGDAKTSILKELGAPLAGGSALAACQRNKPERT